MNETMQGHVMPTAQTGESIVYFAHCPKAAGSSVERYLIARFGEIEFQDLKWETTWREGGWKTDMLKCSVQHMTWDQACAHLPKPPDHVFAITRDPLKRLISEYNFQRSKRARRWQLFLLTRLGFSIWWRVMRRLITSHPHFMDNHLVPQVQFPPPEDWRGKAGSRAAIFKMEEGFSAPLVDWLDQISPDTASERVVEHTHKTRGVKAQVMPTVADIAYVTDIYAQDYARFDYPPPDVAKAPSDPFSMAKDVLAVILAPLVGWLYDRGRM